MRHLLGCVLGLVLIPVVLVVPGWGAPRLLEIAGFNGTLLSFTGVSTVGALTVLTLVVGLCLVSTRLSPLAPGLPALALAGVTVAHIAAPQLLTGLLPYPDGMQALVRSVDQLVTLGLYLPVAAALFLPVLLPSRWRGRDPDDVEDYLDDFYDEDERSAGDEEAVQAGRDRYSGRRRAEP
ncbi:hypothetical protein RIF23_02325 [Lipingzhangella sp. LS1_29]|uniref:Uncharacterized protein n=1 Tax=Lipingzhangella rawalii TaxID=2055835 RepID=A0ABU2H1E7_9ACTN|nr:hypothetical protein [Lipingzhangella rawalii]MDS1269128.1 hypothetical protein [Lipingzhangella rawalii]